MLDRLRLYLDWVRLGQTGLRLGQTALRLGQTGLRQGQTGLRLGQTALRLGQRFRVDYTRARGPSVGPFVPRFSLPKDSFFRDTLYMISQVNNKSDENQSSD